MRATTRAEYVLDGPVDLGASTERPLVRERVRVAQTGQGQAVPDPGGALAVAGEPRDRADGAGREQEAIGEPARVEGGEMAGEKRRDRDAREVVIAERRVAHVSRDEHLVGPPPRKHELSVGEAPRLEGGVDADLILALRQRVELALGEAEPPALVVVGGAVGDPVRLIGQGVKMGAQILQGQSLADGNAVADDVQVRPPEVHHAFAAGVLDPGVPDVPLLGYRPVQDGRP